jgi:hypothetical protein
MAQLLNVDPNFPGPFIVESYLKKAKRIGASMRILSKFTKRWFILDLKSGVFYYLKKKTSKTPEKSYAITDIIGFNRNPRIKDVSDWKFAFSIEFKPRTYILYAESVSVHQAWCNTLGAIRTRMMAPPQIRQEEFTEGAPGATPGRHGPPPPQGYEQYPPQDQHYN